MNWSWLLIDFSNYSEIFLFALFIVLNGYLLFTDVQKRNNLIAGLKGEMKKRKTQESMVKLLQHFIGVQKQLQKNVMKRIHMITAIHLVLYFIFLYGYYRIGALLFTVILYLLMIGLVKYIFSREIN